ncbi:MAG: ABC transporter permease [Theionarchaea archaeon]|nr:ABC transporter permease [Theionarchaea archaeon]
MSQITAVLEKIVKESLRDRVILFFTFAIPVFFVLIMPFMWGDAPQELMPPLKGGLCLTMITFMMMVAGQSNLAGFIASDRERGLYLRIISMPVTPLKEALGRISGIVVFSLLGAGLVFIVGILYGAEFTGGTTDVVESLGFFVLIMVASTGIGLIIASVVKGESAATHTGIALTLLTAFVGGMFAPYPMLPSFLQVVARIHPVASANASIVYLLQGELVSYYNPLTQWQVILTIMGSCALFAAGVAMYSKLCWRRR